VANVFISYARRDKDRVAALTAAIEAEGLSVWWDSDLVPGRRYRQVIADQLAAADCVIVTWTAASLESDWVQDEAEEGRQRGVLIPVLLEPVRAPAGFRQVQAADLSQWTGSAQHPEFRSLVFAVRSLVQIARATGQSAAPPPPGAVAEAAAESTLPAPKPTAPPEPPPAVTALPDPVPTPVAPTTAKPHETVSIAAHHPKPEPPRTAATQVGVKRPVMAVVTERLAESMFGWPWWLGVTVAMAACVLLADVMEGDQVFWPYLGCAAPLLAGAVAIAGRRGGLERHAKAIAAWCGVGAGLLLGLLSLVATHDDRTGVPVSVFYGLVATSLMFALAVGGLFLGRRRQPSSLVARSAQEAVPQTAASRTSFNQGLANRVFSWPLWLAVTLGMAMCAHISSPDDITPYLCCGAPLAAAAVARVGERRVPTNAAKTIAAWIVVVAGFVVGLSFAVFRRASGRRLLLCDYLGLLAASAVFILASGVLLLLKSGAAKNGAATGRP
jgi:hypothetical protein